MKYAVTYYRDFRYFKEVDEIILYWSTKDDIVDYVKTTYAQNQRIIVSIDNHLTDDEIEQIIIPILEKLKAEHNNITIRFDNWTGENLHRKKEQLKSLKEKGIRYYFNQPCTSWDLVYGLVSLGASDIIVTETMGFDLVKISEYCKPRKVKIRIYPNVAQYGGYGVSEEIPDVQKFFVRPEDTEIYEPYVDVFEIWGDFERQSVLFEIYKQQYWLGNLNDIIYGLNEEIPNECIMDHFALIRLSCRKKCMQGEKRCQICPTIMDLAKTLDEEELIIKKERKPFKENETIIEEALSTTGTEADELSEEEIGEI